jgi:hypothetical protein
VRILQGNVGGSFVLARVRADSRSQFDLGKVSQSWITEQRAGQHRETGHEWEPPPFNQRGSQVDNAADAHPPDLEASSATIPAVTGSPRARTGMSASHQPYASRLRTPPPIDASRGRVVGTSPAVGGHYVL